MDSRLAEPTGISHPRCTIVPSYGWVHIYYLDCKACGVRYATNLKKSRGCSDECVAKYINCYSNDRKWIHLYYLDCQICGKRYIAKHPRSLGCSAACRDRNRNYKRAKIRRGVGASDTFKCENCGVEVNRAKTVGRYRFCSKRCLYLFQNRKHDGMVKRTVPGIASETIDRIAVFERDGYRCHLCRVKVDPKRSGKHLWNSPELDHILPLSQGGSHTYDNVACCCARCNRTKQGKPMGQMRLPIERAWRRMTE